MLWREMFSTPTFKEQFGEEGRREEKVGWDVGITEDQVCSSLCILVGFPGFSCCVVGPARSRTNAIDV